MSNPIKMEFPDLIEMSTTEDCVTTFNINISSNTPMECIVVPDDKWDEIKQICADLGIEIVE